MNKKILFSLVLTLMLIFVGISKVAALDTIEVNQELLDSVKAGTTTSGITYSDTKFSFASGIYTLTSHITLEAGDAIATSGNVTINMQSFRISANNDNSAINATGGLTITGTGIITNANINSYALVSNSATVNLASVTYGRTLAFYNNSVVTIDGGLYNKIILNDSKITINTAAILGPDSLQFSNSDITIKDGTFLAPTGCYITVSDDSSLNISGGTFQAGDSGLCINTDSPNVKLSGGSFSGNPTNSYATAIDIDSSVDVTFADLLAYGYKYSLASETTTGRYSEKSVDIEAIPTHTVTFKDGSTILGTQSVFEGASATMPTTPTKSGYEFDSWVNTDGKTIDSTITEDTIFTAKWSKLFDFVSGGNQTFNVNSDEDVTFVVDAPFSEFDSFELIDDDNNVVSMASLTAGTDYVLESGSTKLTFKNSFLKTLDLKNYHVKLYYNNGLTYGSGYASTTLTIQNINEVANNTVNPHTADSITLYIAIFVLSAIGLAVSGVYIKNKVLN